MRRSLLLVMIGLLFISGALGETTKDAVSSNNTTGLYAANSTLSSIPDTRQSTEYSCGAAALQAVLRYWGRDIGEEDMREMLNTNEETGTYPDDIIRVARETGLEAVYGENLTLADVEASLKNGVPVIVDCQAWRSVSERNESWADEYSSGHWMVIIGIDREKVYFEDPYILGSRGFMSRQEFEERWHNWRGLDDSDTAKQVHMGIFIRGDNPTAGQSLRHVD